MVLLHPICKCCPERLSPRIGPRCAAMRPPLFRSLLPSSEALPRMHTEVAAVLIDIEAELRRLRLWDDVPPDPGDLASTQPFAIDTLTLPQWLQFIFLPTMYRLIDAGASLPTQCGITPMAEEYFRGREVAIGGLLDALERVDVLLSESQPDYAPGRTAAHRRRGG